MGVHHLLSDHIAKRFEGKQNVIDTNTGAGTTAIALAKYAASVTSVDINSEHLAQAEENARIAAVADKITFVHADILSFLERTDRTFDAALLDPDWAAEGEEKTTHVTSLEYMQPHGQRLFELVSTHTENICFRLPKEIEKEALKDLPPHEIEPLMLDGELKFYCAWFGSLMK